MLTHCGLLNMVNITWTNVDSSLVRFSDIHLRAISYPCYSSVQWVWKSYFKILFKSPRGQWVNKLTFFAVGGVPSPRNFCARSFANALTLFLPRTPVSIGRCLEMRRGNSRSCAPYRCNTVGYRGERPHWKDYWSFLESYFFPCSKRNIKITGANQGRCKLKINQGSTLRHARMPGACRSCLRAHKLFWLHARQGKWFFNLGMYLFSQKCT